MANPTNGSATTKTKVANTTVVTLLNIKVFEKDVNLVDEDGKALKDADGNQLTTRVADTWQFMFKEPVPRRNSEGEDVEGNVITIKASYAAASLASADSRFPTYEYVKAKDENEHTNLNNAELMRKLLDAANQAFRRAKITLRYESFAAGDIYVDTYGNKKVHEHSGYAYAIDMAEATPDGEGVLNRLGERVLTRVIDAF